MFIQENKKKHNISSQENSAEALHGEHTMESDMHEVFAVFMRAEAKDLWGKTLPHEILLQVPYMCSFAFFFSTANNKQKGEKRLPSPFSFTMAAIHFSVD